GAREAIYVGKTAGYRDEDIAAYLVQNYHPARLEATPGRNDYLVWLQAIKKRPQMCLLPSPISLETLYLVDRTWAHARKDAPRVNLVQHLAKLKNTGNVVAASKDISFEEALDELIKLVERTPNNG